MDTVSAAALARELGTSVPRVTRAVERLGIDARQENGRLGLTRHQAARLRRELGVTPRIEGLTSPQVKALAALRSAPFGLVSARAVARRSGLSPTTSARTLESLLAEGLVTRTDELIAAGRAREEKVWRANVLHPRWPELDLLLDRVEAPERSRPTADRVPMRLRHLFWNTAESQLDVRRAGPYIARRLLRTMDIQGLAWGVQALRPVDWREGAKARGLDTRVKRLALNLAAPSEGTLKGLFGATKLEVFGASRLTRLAPPAEMTGLNVAAMQDLMAMKLKVMAERGEMRDYFDVKTIDEEGGVSVEEGIELYLARYGVNPRGDALPHLYRAMGDLSDVEDDEALPIEKRDLQRWWATRQVQVLRNSDRFS